MTSFEVEVDLITYDKDGSVRLLPGYKFDPTDEVLVNFYLKRKAFAQPLPVQIIQDFDVFQTEPWGLPREDGKFFNEQKFFFYNNMGYDFESLNKRVAGNGQWMVVEKGKEILIPQNNQVIGKRNTLIFYEVQGSYARRTEWVMHEFRLVLIANPSKMTNWAVYRIFQKKDAKNARQSNGKSSNNIKHARSVEVIDFNAKSDNFSVPFPLTPSLSESSESSETYDSCSVL